MRRVLSSSVAMVSALSIGIAKPMPWAPARTATLMPIISPSMFSSGPPELPGIDAGVGLDQVFVALRVAHLHGAMQGADDACVTVCS